MQLEDKTKGRLYGCTAMLIFTFCIHWIKQCRSPPSTTALLRGIGDILLVLAHTQIKKESLFDNWTGVNVCLLRALFGSITVFSINVGSKLVKISVFSVITRLQTVLMTFLGIYFLGNKFSSKVVIAGGLSLLGVTLVVAPGLLGLGSGSGLELNWTPAEIVGVICAFVFVVSDSLSYIVLTLMAGKVSMYQVVFYLNIGITLSNGLMMIFKGEHLILYWSDIPYYLCIICGYYFGQLIFTIGAKLEPNVGVQAVLQSMFVIYSLLIDVFLVGNSVSLVNYVGCGIVTASSIWAVLLRA